MLYLSDAKSGTEWQLGAGKACLRFLATKAVFVFGSLHKWVKTNTSLVKKKLNKQKKPPKNLPKNVLYNLPDSNAKPMSCQFKTVVCFFLFAIIQKKNKWEILPPYTFKRAIIKKNDSVTAPTHFAQVSKSPSSDTGSFPSDRDAYNQPSLRTAIGYIDT